MREMQQGDRSFLSGGSGGGLSPFSALRDESPAGLHLNVQASLHGAHLHVLVQVSVHVALRCGQLHLRSGRLAVTHTREKHRHATPAAAVLVPSPLETRAQPQCAKGKPD